MNLGDQLDELREGILRDRSDLIAGDEDSFWTDESLLRYIGEAERKFARSVMCLRDSTTAKYTRFTLREGVTHYPLDMAVFAVVSARAAGRDYDLTRTGHTLIESRDVDTSLTFDPNDASTMPPGAPLGIYTDETLVYANQSRVTASIFPTPDATAAGTVINMRVIRLPCGPYTLADLERESEIPLDYQLDVLEWAAYRAKRNNDADIGQTPNADSHKALFDESVARAIRDTKNRLHQTTGVQYGRNGFTWGR